MSLLDVCRRAASSGSGPSKNWRWPPSSRWSGAKQKCPLVVKVWFSDAGRDEHSHTDSGRRLKTSKERNRGKGHVLGGACALTMGI